MKTIIFKILFTAMVISCWGINSALATCSVNINGSGSVCPGATEMYSVSVFDGGQIPADVQHQITLTNGRFDNGQRTMTMTVPGSALSFDVTWDATATYGRIRVVSTYSGKGCEHTRHISFEGNVSGISSILTSCNSYRMTANGASGPYEWQVTGGSPSVQNTTSRTLTVNANSFSQSVTVRVRSTVCGSSGIWRTRTLSNHRYSYARINGPGTMVCRSFTQGYFSLGNTSHISRVEWRSTSSGGGSLNISSPNSKYGTSISGFKPNNMYSINARLYCGNTMVKMITKTVVTGLNCRLENGTEGLSYYSYPNPFDEQTNIEFTIPKDESVTLTIIDARGRTVATLLSDDIKVAGTHTVVFDATQHPSGLYYCLIRAGEYTGAQKMILAR